MFNSSLCCSEPENPPAGHADPNTILPSPEAADALGNSTPLVVHADPNTTLQEENPWTGDISIVQVRIMHKLEDHMPTHLWKLRVQA